LAGKSGVNVNRNKILIAGDGSGGNLAASVAQRFPTKIMMQILINPALQMLDLQTPSYRDNADVISGITSPEKEIFHWLLYLGHPQALRHTVT
jgi:acetyl esterase/lipase